MGFRDYQPAINRFTVRDTYNGALKDLNLSSNPWTGNRYAFTGGNPIIGIELDGHCYTGMCGPDGGLRRQQQHCQGIPGSKPGGTTSSRVTDGRR
ncbi:hypothetical protein Actkin_04288 [Actinokineospora sp. UTMC 2448]|nr:hypothetical protein Actkin_04288 [Actinokineospora sp. UTMC 2448]